MTEEKTDRAYTMILGSLDMCGVIADKLQAQGIPTIEVADRAPAEQGDWSPNDERRFTSLFFGSYGGEGWFAKQIGRRQRIRYLWPRHETRISDPNYIAADPHYEIRQALRQFAHVVTSGHCTGTIERLIWLGPPFGLRPLYKNIALDVAADYVDMAIGLPHWFVGQLALLFPEMKITAATTENIFKVPVTDDLPTVTLYSQDDLHLWSLAQLRMDAFTSADVSRKNRHSLCLTPAIREAFENTGSFVHDQNPYCLPPRALSAAAKFLLEVIALERL